MYTAHIHARYLSKNTVYCFSTARMVARMGVSVTFYLHCLSCLLTLAPQNRYEPEYPRPSFRWFLSPPSPRKFQFTRTWKWRCPLQLHTRRLVGGGLVFFVVLEAIKLRLSFRKLCWCMPVTHVSPCHCHWAEDFFFAFSCTVRSSIRCAWLFTYDSCSGCAPRIFHLRGGGTLRLYMLKFDPKGCLTLEDETNRFSLNVGKKLPFRAA